jgi:hypothetical protein
MWPPRLFARHPAAVTKPSVAFSSNSVEEFFTNSRRVNLSFANISWGTVTVCWRADSHSLLKGGQSHFTDGRTVTVCWRADSHSSLEGGKSQFTEGRTVTFYWRAKMSFHPTFHISWSISVKLGTARKSLSYCEFQASLFTERRTGLKGANERNCVHVYHILRPLWTEFNAGDVHNKLLSDFKFCDNRRGEGNNLPIGVIKITFTHVPWNRMTFRK